MTGKSKRNEIKLTSILHIFCLILRFSLFHLTRATWFNCTADLCSAALFLQKSLWLYNHMFKNIEPYHANRGSTSLWNLTQIFDLALLYPTHFDLMYIGGLRHLKINIARRIPQVFPELGYINRLQIMALSHTIINTYLFGSICRTKQLTLIFPKALQLTSRSISNCRHLNSLSIQAPKLTVMPSSMHLSNSQLTYLELHLPNFRHTDSLYNLLFSKNGTRFHFIDTLNVTLASPFPSNFFKGMILYRSIYLHGNNSCPILPMDSFMQYKLHTFAIYSMTITMETKP